ncbi:MAG: hypothetical protein KatS3mg003_0825 [Candidatus Nitrosocaldaceae archaeon]|nr:MAG: hypothetical protein KatS3mg003_0825 [Candidatus Nitrosocaldaceae archaeon]
MNNIKEPFDVDKHSLIPHKDISYLTSQIFDRLTNTFGYTITNHIKRYMDLYNIDISIIEKDPKTLKEMLSNIFGEYALILEREIVRVIFDSKGLELDQLDDIELAIIKLKIDKKSDIYKEYLYGELSNRSKYCKICNKDVYGKPSLASLCAECYKLQEELVDSMLNGLKF